MTKKRSKNGQKRKRKLSKLLKIPSQKFMKNGTKMVKNNQQKISHGQR